MDRYDSRSRSSTRSRRSPQRDHPYDRNSSRNKRYEDDDLEVVPDNSIKVSATSDVTALSQQISDSCLNNDPHTLLTIGNNSINQAVKGIAVANAELNKRNLQLTFQPAFRDENRTRPRIAFYLSTSRYRQDDLHEDESDSTQLTVAGQSKIKPVAGAIAGRIRENTYVVATAVGVDAVSNAVLAAGNARLYLESEGLDVKVLPAFTKIEKNGQSLNALRFICLSERI
ncbi:hypothetical protein CEUSTIGMA_g882.t1 [Chlamydomonas eustigma]|uniref:Uncharacterized protein n=1 Tax=Chlamydomonas eustigma TaxID=1157962 RepID=A0A250WSB8_9CHLO|nr:hypothetical protein CEUSTIGMA_g882.t1 [Chlamydomonas eustigma]|eukprot:GAX73430.1 hypothetical protein CEUSTIGMA_g882.t1 [Chlamydomonas eustigma]